MRSLRSDVISEPLSSQPHYPFIDLPNVCAPLLALGRDPVVGRFMVAARDIEAGEVIFHDEPACIGESSSHLYCV